MGRDERAVTTSIGIDITHLAITRIKKRLRDSFGEAIDRSRATVGEPVSLPYALGLVGARPVEQNEGYSRRGIDGRNYFHDEHDAKSATKKIIISVKGIEYPPVWHELTFKKAPKAKGNKPINEKTLDFD